MPGVLSSDDAMLVAEARKSAAAYDDMRELIRIGAYRDGANADVDRAIALHPELEDFLSQAMDECVSSAESFTALRAVLQKENVQ